MKSLRMTNEMYDFISEEISHFNKRTNFEYDMDMEEVLFSFLNSTETVHFILNDWNEGKFNDPYWDEERNQHCCEVFLFDMNTKLNNFKSE